MKTVSKQTETKPLMRSKGTPEREKAPPAYFLSLSVENFRCFGPNQILDLSNGNGRPAHWTVILGDNGTGKTTLLQAFVAFEPTVVEDQGEELVEPRLSSDTEEWLDRWQPKDQSNAFSSASLSATYAWGAMIGELDRLFNTDNTQIEIFDNGVSSVYHWKIHAGFFGLQCFAYGAARRMSNTALSEVIDDAVAGLFSDDHALLNAEEWLLQADYAAERSDSKADKARRDRISDLLIDLLPDVTAIRFAEPEPPRLVPRVEFETPYGWVPVHGLSLGYRTLTAWMVDLARRMYDRYPDSPNPLAEPAVVLVDEIDLHLHPKWQRKLIGFLSERFPNTQFIVTAHSPLVVQAAGDANVVVLRREGDHVVIDNDPPSVRGWRMDQILSSELFEGVPARAPEAEAVLEERRKLLAKKRLTAKDRARLRELEAAAEKLPTGDTPEDIEAMDVIRRAADLLKQAEGQGG